MRSSVISLLACIVVPVAASAQGINPVTINFENRPSGPSIFATAGPAQSFGYDFGGFTALFSGGVILTNETNQTTNFSNVYATASFGQGLSNPITIQFSAPVQNFQMSILNAIAGNYTLSDNAGHSSQFNLATTGGSASTQTFTTAGTLVNVLYNGPGTSGALFDFAIDNIIATPSVCASIVNRAVTFGAVGNTMTAAFTPNNSLSLADAAAQCGYTSFNWQQTVTTDPYPPRNVGGQQLTAPYSDPPPGGYFGAPDAAYPYYLNQTDLATGKCPAGRIMSLTTLLFCDTPAEPSLKPGEFLGFNTRLVGTLPDGIIQSLFSFDWIDSFDGTVQGGSARKNFLPVDLDSGTGGIDIVAVNGLAVTSTPEPSTFALLGLAMLSTWLISRRRTAR